MKLFATHAADVSVQFVNANGRKADIQGEVDWTSSNPSVATVAPHADDSHMATITAGPSAGEATISAMADSDLGDGVTEVEALIEVVVIAKGVAIGGEISRLHPNHALPGRQPVDPGFGTDAPAGGHVDNSLPGGRPATPDQGLPPTAQPKS